jgi:hypothetical protein
MKSLPPGAARSSGPRAVEPTPVDRSRFLRVSEAASALGVSKTFVRSMIAEGLLPARRLILPNRPATRAPLLIERADLDRAVERFALVTPRGEAR